MVSTPSNNKPYCLQEAYLKSLSECIASAQGLTEIQKLCFLLRFNPKNKELTHANIASRINRLQEGVFKEESINRTVSIVAKKVKRTFENEMVKVDEVDVDIFESQSNRKQGNPGKINSPYELVYEWMWSKKFPREAWQLSKNIAKWANGKIQIIPIVRQQIEPIKPEKKGLKLSEIPDDNNLMIRQGEKYCLEVNLGLEGYLILINEDRDGCKPLLCPSRAFTRCTQLSPTEPMYLPPKERDSHHARSMIFDDKGDEYFLAIVTEEFVDLSWIKPDIAPKDIYLSQEQIKEIFTKIGKQGNSRVFYKRFNVIA